MRLPLGLKGGTDGLIKTAGTDAIRYSAVPGGRILHGSLAVESTRSLAKLEGVVRVTGDLSIQESVLKSAELLVLKSLTEVGGRLTLEGNAALQLIDAFENLERARGIYVGFNPGIARVSLPKLREIEAALIFEANTALTEINLPAFSKGGLYVHVHDNQALTTVLLRVGESGDDLLAIGLVLAVIVAVLMLALASLLMATRILRLMGETGANVISRVLGVVLAALAVQYVLNGLQAQAVI